MEVQSRNFSEISFCLIVITSSTSLVSTSIYYTYFLLYSNVYIVSTISILLWEWVKQSYIKKVQGGQNK